MCHPPTILPERLPPFGADWILSGGRGVQHYRCWPQLKFTPYTPPFFRHYSSVPSCLGLFIICRIQRPRTHICISEADHRAAIDCTCPLTTKYGESLVSVSPPLFKPLDCSSILYFVLHSIISGIGPAEASQSLPLFEWGDHWRTLTQQDTP